MGQTYITFSADSAQRMYPQSINRSGAVTGYWQSNGNSFFNGFVRDARGTITTFTVGSLPTCPVSINDTGTIAGYTCVSNNQHGFVRTSGGTVTTFDPPDSKGTTTQAINAEGAIAGYFYGPELDQHGFVRYPNGLITTFDPPGSTNTIAKSINAIGIVAGSYSDSAGTHGFVRYPGGQIVSFDAPGSTGTQVLSINVFGAIAGWYQEAGTSRHIGFIRDPLGHFTTFDPGFQTHAASINNLGMVAGGETTSAGTLVGFVRDWHGAITAFSVPDSIATQAMSINDLGVITGWCRIGVNQPAFIRLP
jgi:uncharacterized membrane protein